MERDHMITPNYDPTTHGSRQDAYLAACERRNVMKQSRDARHVVETTLIANGPMSLEKPVSRLVVATRLLEDQSSSNFPPSKPRLEHLLQYRRPPVASLQLVTFQGQGQHAPSHRHPLHCYGTIVNTPPACSAHRLYPNAHSSQSCFHSLTLMNFLCIRY